MDYQVSSLPLGPVCTQVAPLIQDIAQYDIDSDPIPEFTWLKLSLIVDNTSPHIGGSDWSLESSIIEPYTPSQFDAPVIEQSPVACGSFQFLDSFSLSHLYRHSTFNFDLEDHIDNSLRDAMRPLDSEDPVSTSPASCSVSFKDSDICLGLGASSTMPTDEDDEALVRMSIKSLDFGEEPVFDLPTGWKEAFVSPSDIMALPSLQAESMKKSSVLPMLKSLLKRAASKFVSRRE